MILSRSQFEKALELGWHLSSPLPPFYPDWGFITSKGGYFTTNKLIVNKQLNDAIKELRLCQQSTKLV